jgi:G3E family GTPase
MIEAEAIPLHVVTGFLGAGKTALINRLLRTSELADTLVIVNEWGEISLDHLLYETIPGDVISMASGCLCCTLRGDLVDCLLDLLARRDSGSLARFKRVVLETTGLAEPGPILHALMADRVLSQRFRLAGVATLVDAANGLATLGAHRESARQAALADRLALTKSDLIEGHERGARLEALRAALRDLNPFAPMFDVAAGEFGPAELMAEADEIRFADEPSRDQPHADSLRSYAFTAEAPVSGLAFTRFLTLLWAMLGPRLLRVKGLVRLADDESEPLVIHGAQHVFHTPRRLAAWPDGDRRTRIVVIADGVERREIERLWGALSPEPEIDAPDLAALTESPLAPRAGGLLA